MDLGNVSFIGLVVITLIGVIKESFPAITGNMTRLVALVIGLVLGLLGQFNLLPDVSVNVVTGIMAAIAAVGTMTAIDRITQN
jgi:hypothetical protein